MIVQLEDHQISELFNLFPHIENKSIFRVIQIVNGYFESFSLPSNMFGDSPSRENRSKKQSKLLKEITFEAKKLKSLIGQVQKGFLDSIENEITEYSVKQIVVKSPYYEEIYKNVLLNNNDEIIKYNINIDENYSFCGLYSDECENVDTKEILDILISRSQEYAEILDENFTSGYLDSFIMMACDAWSQYIGEEIKSSESSLFVKYVAILLNTSSTEKVSKFLSRSKWLRTNKAVIDMNCLSTKNNRDE